MVTIPSNKNRVRAFLLELGLDCADITANLHSFIVLDLWKVFYNENWRFDLGALRVANRSPTPISKSNEFLGQSDDTWGVRGPHFRPNLGVFGARAGRKT